MKKMIFILFLILAFFSVAGAETVYIPEKVVIPASEADLEPYLALEGARLQQSEYSKTDQYQLFLKGHQLLVINYDKALGRIAEGNIFLDTQIDLDFHVQIVAAYDNRSGMIMALTANADIQDGEKYKKLTDDYNPDGSYLCQRKILTAEEDRLYYYKSSPDPASTYIVNLPGTTQQVQIPANTWMCFLVRDGALVESFEETPEHSEKLADIIIAGELDPLKLEMVEGELQFIPDADEIEAALVKTTNEVKTEAVSQTSGVKAENKEPEKESQPTATPQADVEAVVEAGEYKNIRISVNGEKVILLDENDEQQKSYIVNGNIYVPVIPFITAVGGKIEYNEEQNQITIELPSGASVEAVVPDITPVSVATPEPKEPYLLGWDEEVSLDNVSFTMTDFRVLREIRGNAAIGIFYAEKTGIKYLAAIGTIRNDTGAPLSGNSFITSFLLDGKNTYRGRTAIMYNESVVDELPAAANGKLYIYAEVPEEIARDFTTAEIEFGMNEKFNGIPANMEQSDYLYLLSAGDDRAILAKEEPPREKTYYSESPSLPVPTSYADLNENGHSTSSKNKKLTKIEYRYKAHYKSDTIDDLTDIVISGLQEDGYTIAKSGNSYIVKNGNKELAKISNDSNSILISITPGNEGLKTLPVKTSSSSIITTIEEVKTPTVRIGGTMKTSYAELTFSKSGQTSQLLSYTTKSAPRSWRYYEPNSTSNLLFYVQGQFKNKASREINISNIYAELTFDGKEKYNCSVTSLYDDGRGFTTSVIAQDQVTYYIYTEVPKSVLNSYKKCELKVGLTKDFDYRSLTNGVYNFDRCDDIIIVDLSKK